MVVLEGNALRALHGLIIFVLLIGLSACQSERYVRIPREKSVVITVNLLEGSLTFIDSNKKEEIAKWGLEKPISGATVLPDQETILLYGTKMKQIYLYNMTMGKPLGTWDVGEGIANVKISKDKKSAYLIDQQTNSVRIVDLNGHEKAEIKVGKMPLTMVEGPDGAELYVLNFHDNILSVVDVETKKVSRTIPIKTASTGAALVPELNEIWIGGHGEGVVGERNATIYSTVDGKVNSTVEVPVMPIDFETSGSNIYVLSHGTNTLRKIDLKSREILGELVVGANPFDMMIVGNDLYVASYDSDEIIVVDQDRFTIIDQIKTGKGPFQIVYREGGKS